VGVLFADDFLSGARVREQADEVAHAARRDEESRLAAEDLRGARLQAVHRRVFHEHVVADVGLGHRTAHLRGRLGDGVAS
jgi:hypothetical protein